MSGRELNAAVVRDEKVRGMLEREKALRAELVELQKQLRQASSEKDATLLEQQKEQDDYMLTFRGELDKIQAEKNEVHEKLDELRVEQDKLSQMRDELKIVEFEVGPLNRELGELRRTIDADKEKIRALEQQRQAKISQAQYHSMTDAQADIDTIERQISEATKKNNTTLVSALTKKKTTAEKGLREISAAYAMDDHVAAARKKLEAQEAKLAAQEEKRKALEVKRQSLREALPKVAAINTQVDALRKRLAEIGKQSAGIRGQQVNRRPVSKDLGSTNEQLARLRSRRDAVTTELSEIAASIPKRSMVFDPTHRIELVGRGGATLNQLQGDFGVIITLDRGRDNQLQLIGGEEDCSAAVSAIESLLAAAERNNQHGDVHFDPTLTSGLIGTKGANINRIRDVSGVTQLRVDKSGGRVEIVGTVEAIDTAKRMIDEFVSANMSATIPFPAGVREYVIGRGGETVERIKQESGAKRISVDRDASMIRIFGTKEAVEAAKLAYTELLQGISESTFSMRADDHMIRLVIGPKGKTIKEIQDATHAIITVEKGTVTIRGSTEAVNRARTLIEDTTRREEVKIPFDSILYDFLTTRTEEAVDAKEAECAPGAATDEEPQEAHASKPAPKAMASPLERIRDRTGCDQVSAIHAESKIVLRGRQEQVNQARVLISDLLRQHSPATSTIPVPHVVALHLIPVGRGRERSESDAKNILEVAREKHGLIACSAERDANCVTVSSWEPATTKAAVDELTPQLAALAAGVGTLPVRAFQFGGLIGPQGRTIRELEKATKSEISVDKEGGMVNVFAPEGADALKAAIAKIEEVLQSMQPPPERAAKGAARPPAKSSH